jgi:hypothetical protein
MRSPTRLPLEQRREKGRGVKLRGQKTPGPCLVAPLIISSGLRFNPVLANEPIQIFF